MTGKYQAKSEGSNVGAVIKGFIERVERLNEEKDAITGDIREVYAEAKGNGLDPKILRIIIRQRKMDAQELAEQEALVDTYKASIGMLPPDDEDEDETSSSD